MEKRIDLPLTKEKAAGLVCGDAVYLSGVIYTARDAAHKRIVELIERGGNLPFQLRHAVIYYVGPTPAKPGEIIGSAGPTTSYRMDAYAPLLLDRGLSGMIGKGKRGENVVDAIKRNGAVYFGAIGGAGALLAGRVSSCEVVAFPELGPEAVHRLVVEDFPCTVVIDAKGGNLYERGRADYLKSLE